MTDEGGAGVRSAGHDVEHTGRQPARSASSAKRSGPNGASSAGLSTTQLPAASAGTTFIATDTAGPFHGVRTATTPYGSGRV